ncbi:methionyl-tRNA formyltransferase [Candidatus Sumerlaeota bacterium]|nr:methionyl-tRNA formyltransferase [Candidatus Sumerlaeota bacterium]
MRIVFMGTPAFAVPTLESLVRSDHEVVAVVTQPDRPAGRGRRVTAPPIKEVALNHGLPLLQPEDLKDERFIAELKSFGADLAVVVAFSILPAAVLDIPRLGCINLHPSLLPLYRGAAPVNWAIINGETETGVTIIKLTTGVDAGAILSQERVPILEDDDAVSLGNMLSVLGASHILRVVDEAEKTGVLEGSPQDESRVTRAPKLKKEDGRIDWSRPTESLVCLVRGTVPWPGAATETKKGPLRLLQVEPLWPEAAAQIAEPERMEPGTVALILKSHGFAVRTGDGFLLVLKAQPADKSPMSGIDMINGHYVREGDRLVALS